MGADYDGTAIYCNVWQPNKDVEVLGHDRLTCGVGLTMSAREIGTPARIRCSTPLRMMVLIVLLVMMRVAVGSFLGRMCRRDTLQWHMHPITARTDDATEEHGKRGERPHELLEAVCHWTRLLIPTPRKVN